ncbi:MAG TPA: glycosyltransferase family 2 protein [Gemmatimonadaceae bacterium]|nr:glycosyltransferase family 2 protein [Gemmatimonadaceae bacterium]
MPLAESLRNDSQRNRAYNPLGGVRPHRDALARTVPVTVIVPAYNEQASLADTLVSLWTQTIPPEEVIVVDDCSTDDTGDVARALGARVIRPRQNTGSKAGAQTFALGLVETPFVIAIDADTTLAPDAIERMFGAFSDPHVAAACGTVIPRNVRTIWERGRYVEYLFAFTFYKRVQDAFGTPLISSGCFSMYRTEDVRAAGGWSTRTLAEDMDLTWTLHQAQKKVRFVPEAVCYPIEPQTFYFLSKQLRRWSHGFVQNVRLHWRGLLRVPFLRHAVAVSFWDAVVAALVYLLALPLVALALGTPLPLLGYIIDVPAVAVPVLVGAHARGETRKALASLPAFFVLRTVNAIYFLRAAFNELLVRRSFTTYEKGH